MIAIVLLMMLVALCGLYAARQPERFAETFLSESQRARLPKDSMPGVAWTGWVIFGIGMATAVVVGIDVAIRTR